MIQAQDISRYLQDLKGSPREKGIRATEFLGIYNRTANKHNVYELFENSPDLLHRVGFSKDEITIDENKYSGKYNINEFIMLCRLNELILFWDSDEYLSKIFLR